MDPRHARSTARRIAIVALTSLCLAAPGCHDGDGDLLNPPGGQPVQVELHYDGNHADSPFLAPATYEAAARFSGAQTTSVAGGKLVEVSFYIASVPDSCVVKIYGSGTASVPGALLYSADVSAAVTANGWNSHTLPAGLDLPSGDLWIAIEFTHAAQQRTIGCDPGPAITDGDWLFATTDGNWTPFHQRFAISVNWNIRGIVEVVR